MSEREKSREGRQNTFVNFRDDMLFVEAKTTEQHAGCFALCLLHAKQSAHTHTHIYVYGFF